MTIEHCVGDQTRDPEWQRACGELLDLWNNAARVADGREPDEEDLASFAILKQAISAQMGLSDILEALQAHSSAHDPTELPTVWQMNYIQALAEAMARLTKQASAIQDLYAAFGEIDVSDAEQMDKLAGVASVAAQISGNY